VLGSARHREGEEARASCARVVASRPRASRGRGVGGAILAVWPRREPRPPVIISCGGGASLHILELGAHVAPVERSRGEAEELAKLLVVLGTRRTWSRLTIERLYGFAAAQLEAELKVRARGNQTRGEGLSRICTADGEAGVAWLDMSRDPDVGWGIGEKPVSNQRTEGRGAAVREEMA
jgi:hypothetical protein